jgi:cation diffusion facilitator family transporter
MEEKKNHIDSLKRGQRIARTATVVILLLAAIKFVIGYCFASSILIADAYHSSVDALAIFASWFGLWIAGWKKSKRFPYGLYKAETFVTFIIGGLITWAGIENLFEGYKRLFHLETPPGFPLLPLSASLLSLVVAYFIATKEKEIGDAINSRALLANASEAFFDIATSFVVMAGILLTYARVPYVEGSVVIIIASVIIWLGIKNVWISVLILMDANLDPKLRSEIEAMISRVEGVKDIHDIKIRQSGPFKMVECEIATSPSIPVYKAHTLADTVERLVTTAYKEIESVFVHVEPSKKDIVSAIIPVEDMNGLQSKVHGHFGRAPYFVILKIHGDHTEIEDFYLNEFLGKGMHIGVKVIKAVIGHGLDVLFTSQIGELSFHMLKDNFVDIYRVQEHMAVQEVIDEYRSGKLEQITAPTHGLEESQITKEVKEVAE